MKALGKPVTMLLRCKLISLTLALCFFSGQAYAAPPGSADPGATMDSASADTAVVTEGGKIIFKAKKPATKPVKEIKLGAEGDRAPEDSKLQQTLRELLKAGECPI